MMNILFGTEITSIHGVVAEKSNPDGQTDGQTAFQLYVYDINQP